MQKDQQDTVGFNLASLFNDEHLRDLQSFITQLSQQFETPILAHRAGEILPAIGIYLEFLISNLQYDSLGKFDYLNFEIHSELEIRSWKLV